MNKWTNIVIHHSASDFGNARVIRNWHLERGWSDIGYHFVIGNGIPYAGWRQQIIPLIGSIEMGRFFDDDFFVQQSEVGAHTLGFNSNSIGICLIHSGLKKDAPYDRFFSKQIESLFKLCEFLGKHFNIPISRFYGHYEKDNGKPDCPGFNMDLFRDALAGPEGRKEFARYMLLNDKVMVMEANNG